MSEAHFPRRAVQNRVLRPTTATAEQWTCANAVTERKLRVFEAFGPSEKCSRHFAKGCSADVVHTFGETSYVRTFYNPDLRSSRTAARYRGAPGGAPAAYPASPGPSPPQGLQKHRTSAAGLPFCAPPLFEPPGLGAWPGPPRRVLPPRRVTSLLGSAGRGCTTTHSHGEVWNDYGSALVLSRF